MRAICTAHLTLMRLPKLYQIIMECSSADFFCFLDLRVLVATLIYNPRFTLFPHLGNRVLIT